MYRSTCLTVLLLGSLWSAHGFAEASALPSDEPDMTLGWRGGSTLVRLQVQAPTMRWEPAHPLLLTPPMATWLLPQDSRPILRLDDAGWSSLSHHYADDSTVGLSAGLDLRNTMPALLHYRGTDSGVSLTLAPGSPCTGACLKVAGSF